MKEISFHIDHLDPLGQGVFKEGKDIYFIGKVLPGEKGEAEVLKKTKGVHKASIKSIDLSSSKRISPSCSHYKECPSCHYLHCSYDDEIAFKKNTLARYLKELSIGEELIKVIPASTREGYRNRVQFHYDVQKNKIGYQDPLRNQIVQVPHCLLMSAAVKKHVDESLKKRKWISDAKESGKTKGYVEYFERDGEIFTSFNQAYARGGFTQVNAPMSDLLKKILRSYLSGNIVELFAGDGRLTEDYRKGDVHCIDLYSQKRKRDKGLFLSLDLYRKNTFKDYCDLVRTLPVAGTLLLNPPRSGFSYLRDWIKGLNPERVVYVSCHPATLVRDLKTIPGKVRSVDLIDLFPSTYHFETVVVVDTLEGGS